MPGAERRTAGEQWTLDVLAALRHARFTPRAWGRFLAASFARAREQRGSHTRARWQLLALSLAGLAASGVAGLSDGRLAVAGSAWLLALVVMVDWHLGMLEDDDGRPLAGLGAANVVTLVRGAALPALFVLGQRGLLVALAVLAVLDVADGRLARRRGETTRLGAWLDGSIDTALALGFAVAAARLDAIPAWLAWLVAARAVAPWVVVAALSFLTETTPRAAGALRAVGLWARGPGLAAAVGLALALAGRPAGVAIAAAAVVASFGALVPLVRRGATASGGASSHSPPPSRPTYAEHGREDLPGRRTPSSAAADP